MKSTLKTVLITVVTVVVILAVMKAFVGNRNDFRSLQPEQLPVVSAGYTPGEATTGPDFIVAAELSVHAVVHVKNELRQRNKTYDDFFDMFNDFFGNSFRQQNNAPIIATGSGVIISPDGYIVTNNHVVQETSRLEVTLNDKRTYEAQIIGTDPSTDLALIKIDAEGLPFLKYGDSDNLKIGEWVLAVGNPFNLTSTVTAGIVSAKARDINILGTNSAIESFIQTDAVVNRGNSGGALVNTTGELVGINAAIASNTGSYTGYSFAIPVNIVKKVVDDFLNYGTIQRAYLGISFAEIDSKLAAQYNLKDLKGVYVMEVFNGGSAANAGIQRGDVIIKIEETVINSKSQLLEAVGRHRPGDKVMVTVVRNNGNKEFTLTLQNRSGKTDLVTKDKIEIFGATFETISESEMFNIGIDHGIKITRIGNGKFQDSGIRTGYIIMYVDRRTIKTTDDLKIELENKKGAILIEGIYPNGQAAYYGLNL
jgi:Do/DeqQ family serine protease